jgi:hypothetical protein
MSVPPPTTASPGVTVREHLIAFEPSRSWGRGRGHDYMRLGPMGAVIEHGRLLERPLRLPLGALQLGLVDPGPAHVTGAAGRFPVLRRLGPTAVIPREEGIEGWLWTSTTGSALTILGDEEVAPNALLLFTTPQGGDAVDCFAPRAAEAIASRSPLGAPAIYGLLFRVAEPLKTAETFRQYALVKPLTDREVPPTLRRSLPDDRPADARIVAGGDPRKTTSVAPPGMG